MRSRRRTGAPLSLRPDVSVLVLSTAPTVGLGVVALFGTPLALRGDVAASGLIAMLAILALGALLGLSLLIGRRRPSRRKEKSGEEARGAASVILRVVRDVRTESLGISLDVAHGEPLRNYARPSAVGASLQWRVAWRCFAATLLAARRCVRCGCGCRAWDRWGFVEALAQLHTETLLLPLPPLLSHGKPRAGHLLSEAVLATQQPFVARVRGGCVGYRGIAFDDKRIFLDRKTSLASLAELQQWRPRGEIRWEHRDRDFIALESLDSLAFPRGVERGGRHPRAGGADDGAAGSRAAGGAAADGAAAAAAAAAAASATAPPAAAAPTELSADSAATVLSFRKLATVVQLHNGYCHWITERLPALALLLPLLRRDPDVQLLVDVRFHGASSENRFVGEFLALLGIAPHRWVRYDPRVTYRADVLYIASPIPASCAHRRLLCAARDAVVEGVGRCGDLRPAECLSGAHVVRIVLVARAGDATVRVLNDAEGFATRLREACAACRRRRVEVAVVRCAQLSVREQVVLFERADIVVGVHGAGLANCLWMRGDAALRAYAGGGPRSSAPTLRSGVHLFELVPCSPPPVRYIFWHLAASMGVRYHAHVLPRAAWSSARISLSSAEERRVCDAVVRLLDMPAHT